MTLWVPRLPIAVDPLIAEAKQRARRRRFMVACLVVAGTSVALGFSLPPRSGGAEQPLGSSIAARTPESTVSASGYIGPLRLDRSSAADIRRFAGKPDFDGVGSFESALADRPVTYLALGYGCSPTRASADRDPGGYRAAHLYCQTVYYLNPRTHALEGFWTDSPTFRTSAGTRPGMNEQTAARLERSQVEIGALPGNDLSTAAASLDLETTCTKWMATTPTASPSCQRGRVTALVLGSRDYGLGLRLQ